MHASTLEKRATTDPRVEGKGRKEGEEEDEVPKEGGKGREGGGGRGRKSDRGEREGQARRRGEEETDRYFFKGIEFHEVFLVSCCKGSSSSPNESYIVFWDGETYAVSADTCTV